MEMERHEGLRREGAAGGRAASGGIPQEQVAGPGCAAIPTSRRLSRGALAAGAGRAASTSSTSSSSSARPGTAGCGLAALPGAPAVPLGGDFLLCPHPRGFEEEEEEEEDSRGQGLALLCQTLSCLPRRLRASFPLICITNQRLGQPLISADPREGCSNLSRSASESKP